MRWNERGAFVAIEFFQHSLRVTLLLYSDISVQNFRRPQTSLKCKNIYIYFLKRNLASVGSEITWKMAPKSGHHRVNMYPSGVLGFVPTL